MKLPDTDFSKVAAPFYIPTCSIRGFQFLHQHLLVSDFLILDIIVVGKWYLIMVLIYMFLMTNVVYICISSICIVSLEKCLFRSFACCKIKLLICLLLSCKSSLYLLDISPLSGMWFAKIFSHSMGCLFTFLMVSFEPQKF